MAAERLGSRRQGRAGERGSNAKSQDSARPIADFHRATRPPPASRHDARREPRCAGEAIETSARPANDERAASVADRWTEFLAGAARFPAHLPAALFEHGRRRRSERRAARYSVPRGRTPDAGEKSPRPGATSAHLSGLPRPRRFDAHHHFHYLHGAAADQLHGANRRHSAVADAHFARRELCHHSLLVALHSCRAGCDGRLPRLRPER